MSYIKQEAILCITCKNARAVRDEVWLKNSGFLSLGFAQLGDPVSQTELNSPPMYVQGPVEVG